jgi:hypothetical protein
VLAYDKKRDQAIAKVEALGLRVIADKIEHDEAPPRSLNITILPAA